MDHQQVLSNTFLFKNFPLSELKKLSAIAREEKLPPHSELFVEGEVGNELYVIVVGTVRVLKKNREGVEEEVVKLGSGSYFGEMVMVDEEHKRSATAITQEPTIVLTLSRADIDKLCASDDKLAHHFYHAVARGLAKRLSITTTDAAFYKSLSKRRE